MPSTESSIVALALLLVAGVVWCMPRLVTTARTRNVTLACLALAATLVHVDFFHYHGPRGAVHWWEFYHYFVGTKYFPELGYTALYEASIVADAEDDALHAPQRELIRSMRTYRLEPRSAVLTRAATIKSTFTPARWRAFKADVAVFRNAAPVAWYASVPLQDHGLNATPPNVLLLGTLANWLARVDAHMFCSWFAWGDIALFALGAWLLGRWLGPPSAFGILFFWAINPLNSYTMVGGAYLRQVYVTLCVLAIGALVRRRQLLASACLAAASALTVLPGLLALGHIVGSRFGDGPERRRGLAFAGVFCTVCLGLALITSLAVKAPSDANCWSAFRTKISLHAHQATLNNVGLEYALGFSDTHNAQAVAASWPNGARLHWPTAMARTRRLRALPLEVLRTSALVLAIATAAYAGAPATMASGLMVLFAVLDVSAYYYTLLCLVPLLFGFERRYVAATCLAFSAIWLLGLVPSVRMVLDRYFFGASVTTGILLSTTCLISLFDGLRADRRKARAAATSPT